MLGLWQLKDVPDQYKMQETCDKAVCVDPWSLGDVPDNLKKQEICDKAVRGDPSSLQFITDWFVTKEDIDLWHDYVYSDWGVSKLYDGYQKRKAQKASIKEELVPIASNPSRWWDWCVPEDEKKETEKLWK